MKLALQPPLPPMEAHAVDTPPRGKEWQYEPKWDGFRCLAFKDGDKVYLQSKSAQPLARYFPEVVDLLRNVTAKRFVFDGELVIPVEGRSSFDQLLQRIHPAASRVQKLAAQFPAMLIVFDLLAAETGKSLIGEPFITRRTELERFAKKYLSRNRRIRLSPATKRLATAEKWFAAADSGLDGIVAKRLDLPYQSANRDGMQKIKHRRTADCVVGGFRFAAGKRELGSLLLGLYDEQGLLNHVGFTSSFTAAERKDFLQRLKPYLDGAGFTGKTPGGPSRWSTRRSAEWNPLQPKLVVEVAYDNFTGERFRHGTTLLRFRPDKRPKACTYEQLAETGVKLKVFGLKTE